MSEQRLPWASDPCSDIRVMGAESVDAATNVEPEHEALEMLGSGGAVLREQTHAVVPWNGTVGGEACVMLPLRCSIAAMATFLFAREAPQQAVIWAPLGAAECSLLYARHASPSPPSGFTCGSPIAPCA